MSIVLDLLVLVVTSISCNVPDFLTRGVNLFIEQPATNQFL